MKYQKHGLHPQQIADLIAVLADFWPQTFSLYERRRRPLKLGIHRDIEAAAAGAITAEEIKVALRSYCCNIGYLLACKEGAARIGLDGEPAGSVTADEAANAASLVAYKRSKRDAANAPATAIPLRPANAAPRRLSLDDLRAAAAERRQREAAP